MDFNDEHFQGPSEGLHKQDMTTFYRSVCATTFGIYRCLLINFFISDAQKVFNFMILLNDWKLDFFNQNE